MNYRLDKKYKRRNTAIITIAALVFLFFLIREGKLAFLSRALTHLATPIWQTESAFTDVFLKQTFTSKKDLLRQNEILKHENERMQIELKQFSLLQEENESLKEIFLRSTDDDTIIGTILVKPTQSPYGTLIIDIGSRDGVEVEDLVFGMGNVVIGEIESVEENTSKVILYSAPGYISQVTLENTGRYFNARGRGAGDFEIAFPRELPVEEGDLFLYPSLQNYLVGIVERVEFDPRDSFKKVLFRSAVNVQELKWVQVKI